MQYLHLIILPLRTFSMKGEQGGKESTAQWKYTHTPRVESEAIAFSSKEPEKTQFTSLILQLRRQDAQ